MLGPPGPEKATSGTRTPDLSFTNSQDEFCKLLESQDLPDSTSERAAPAQRDGGGGVDGGASGDPELAHLAAVWERLPNAIRAGIAAMVRAALPD